MMNKALVGLVMAFLVIVASGKKMLNEMGSVLGIQTASAKLEKTMTAQMVAQADKYLTTTPGPIKTIKMTALSNDPERRRTVESLKDVEAIYSLAYAYTQTAEQKYLDKAGAYLLAWAKINKTSGSPVDENHLAKMFEGYRWIRKSLPESSRQTVDAWLITIADKEMKSIYNDDRDINNWNSHRINIIGQIGFILGDKKYIDYTVTSFKKQIELNLNSDGSSMDFRTRDALHYHSFDLWGLLQFAKTAQLEGISLYDYQSPAGASLRKSVHFLYPYFLGQKVHAEYVKSTVAWDVTSGGKTNIKNWNPKDDLYLLEMAYFFDDTTLPLIQKLRNNYSEIPSLDVLVAGQQRRLVPVVTK